MVSSISTPYVYTRMDAASPISQPLKSPAKTCACDGMLRRAASGSFGSKKEGEHKMGTIMMA